MNFRKEKTFGGQSSVMLTIALNMVLKSAIQLGNLCMVDNPKGIPLYSTKLGYGVSSELSDASLSSKLQYKVYGMVC